METQRRYPRKALPFVVLTILLSFFLVPLHAAYADTDGWNPTLDICLPVKCVPMEWHNPGNNAVDKTTGYAILDLTNVPVYNSTTSATVGVSFTYNRGTLNSVWDTGFWDSNIITAWCWNGSSMISCGGANTPGVSSNSNAGLTGSVNLNITPGGMQFDHITWTSGTAVDTGTPVLSKYYPVGSSLRPQTVPLCTTQLSDYALGVSGTTATIRTKVNVTYTSVAVIVPDGGTSNATPTFSLTSANSVDGAPGYIYGTGTVSSSSTTGRLVLINGSTKVCYQSLTATTGTVRQDGSTTGSVDPTSGSANTDCGWNPFCYVKAAIYAMFVPGSGTFNQWTTFQNTISSRPPFSLITACADYVSGMFTGYDNSGSSGSATLNGVYAAPNADGSNSSQTITFNIIGRLSTDAQNSWYQDAMTITKIFLWSLFAWWAFNRITATFGGKQA